MFSIGEFSRISGLTVKTLRFYHERGILIPASVDPGSGYRYYDEQNLEVASVIRSLRDLDFSLDEIAEILNECKEDADMLSYLDAHKKLLADKLKHYQNLVGKIDQLILREKESQTELNMNSKKFEVEEKNLPSQIVAGIRMKGRYSDCGSGFSRLAKKVGRYIAGKPLCLYYDDEYKEEDADFEPCFPLRKEITEENISVRTLPAVRSVTLVHQGPYESLSSSYAKIMAYAKEKGYDIQLPTREIYLKGPGMIFKGNPKKYLTEIQLPIQD